MKGCAQCACCAVLEALDVPTTAMCHNQTRHHLLHFHCCHHFHCHLTTIQFHHPKNQHSVVDGTSSHSSDACVLVHLHAVLQHHVSVCGAHPISPAQGQTLRHLFLKTVHHPLLHHCLNYLRLHLLHSLPHLSLALLFLLSLFHHHRHRHNHKLLCRLHDHDHDHVHDHDRVHGHGHGHARDHAHVRCCCHRCLCCC